MFLVFPLIEDDFSFQCCSVGSHEGRIKAKVIAGDRMKKTQPSTVTSAEESPIQTLGSPDGAHRKNECFPNSNNYLIR